MADQTPNDNLSQEEMEARWTNKATPLEYKEAATVICPDGIADHALIILDSGKILGNVIRAVVTFETSLCDGAHPDGLARLFITQWHQQLKTLVYSVARVHFEGPVSNTSADESADLGPPVLDLRGDRRQLERRQAIEDIEIPDQRSLFDYRRSAIPRRLPFLRRARDKDIAHCDLRQESRRAGDPAATGNPPERFDSGQMILPADLTVKDVFPGRKVVDGPDE